MEAVQHYVLRQKSPVKKYRYRHVNFELHHVSLIWSVETLQELQMLSCVNCQKSHTFWDVLSWPRVILWLQGMRLCSCAFQLVDKWVIDNVLSISYLGPWIMIVVNIQLNLFKILLSETILFSFLSYISVYWMPHCDHCAGDACIDFALFWIFGDRETPRDSRVDQIRFQGIRRNTQRIPKTLIGQPRPWNCWSMVLCTRAANIITHWPLWRLQLEKLVFTHCSSIPFSQTPTYKLFSDKQKHL